MKMLIKKKYQNIRSRREFTLVGIAIDGGVGSLGLIRFNRFDPLKALFFF